MRPDKRTLQLAQLEAMQQRAAEHLERQKQLVEARFARARSRIMTDDMPSSEQQRIIDAALSVLDEVGLQELSLRKLASKLDIKAPALYWHFKNKEALVDYMAEAILKKEFAHLRPRQPDEAWQDWLVQTCMRLRRAMLAHRDGARVVAGAHLFPAISLMRLFETSLQSLISAGVPMQRANLIIMTAVHFVFGNVIEDQSSPTAEEVRRVDWRLLQADFPLVAQVIKENVGTGKQHSKTEFEAALWLIIDHDV